MIMRRILCIAFLGLFSVAAVTAQDDDTIPQPYPMLFPAGINIPYDSDDPWLSPTGAVGSPDTVGNFECAHWENSGLQLIPYRNELWIFFHPQDDQFVFCGIPLPYPYPASPANISEKANGENALSIPERPQAILGNFTIRPLADLSVAELARAQEDGVIPHQRLADGGFILGFPSAPITIVSFSDYACPHCQTYEEDIIAQVIEIFVATGRARVEYRFFPTIDYRSGGYHSKLAACVGELAEEHFWVGHAFLYQRASRGRLSFGNTGHLLAEATGLEYQALQECTRTVTQVDVDVALGQSAGVRGTPMLSFRYLADGLSLTPARRALPFAELSAIIKQAPHR